LENTRIWARDWCTHKYQKLSEQAATHDQRKLGGVG